MNCDVVDFQAFLFLCIFNLSYKSVHTYMFAQNIKNNVDASVPLEASRLTDDEIQQKLKTLSVGYNNRWLLFSVFGTSTASVLPRLIALWAVGIPLLMARFVIACFAMLMTLGVFGTLVAGTGAGAVVFQATYRDVVHWTMTNDAMQDTWDAVASALALS